MSQKIYTNLDIKGNTTIGDIANATSDTDKFLVSDAGVVKYRTGSEILSDLGINAGAPASNIQHQVKAAVAINKGQAVYVSSADGTNMLVSLASNTTEATSSKTMGLLTTTVAINGFANVIAEGLLAGLDTSTAVAGDPVWLGTGGNLIYGLANKPYAPAHLVFIGIVTRVNASNGEIFVKVQNGFELDELHDVDLKTTTPVNGHILGHNGTLWVNKTIAAWLGYTPYNATNPNGYTSNLGTVTSVSALTLGTTGTDVNSSVATGTTTPVITLNIPDASATARGVITTGAQTIAGSKTFTSTVIGAGFSYTTGSIFPYAGNTVYINATAATHIFGGGPGSVQNNVQVANGTFNIALQTASTIASFDASKNVVSLPTATYPSLAEIAYVKGVTSAIQTQIDNKQTALNGTGFVKASGTTISYDNSTYYLASNPSGYISSYTETDTLATVTARGASTSTAITLSNSLTLAGFGTNSFINGTGDGSSFTTYNFALQGWSSMAFYNPTSGGAYPTQVSGLIDFRAGTINMKGGFLTNSNPVLHSGNYNSYAPSLTGTGASGNWAINISGNAATATLLANVGATSTGTSTWNPMALTYQAFGQKWVHSTISADSGDLTMWLRPSQYVAGGTELNMMIDGDYYAGSGTNKVLHAGNYSSYAVPLTRTITINGTSYDLSANRSWTVTATETDTLSTVTTRGNTTGANIITSYNTTTGVANNGFNTGKTILGNFHVNNGSGVSGNNNQAAITFQGGTTNEAQAGIYVSNNSSTGTAMGFATTDSYTTGPQLFLTANNVGTVNFPRNRPTYAGNVILDAANYNSYAPTLTGGSASGTWGISITGNAGTATQIYQDNEPTAGTYRLILGNASDTTGYVYNFNALYYNSSTSTIQGANISGTAGGVAWTNVSGRPTNVSSFTNDSGYVTAATNRWYDGWVTNPGYDANTIGGSKSGFTYANNAPLNGTLVHFDSGGYGLQLNSNYTTGVCEVSFRSRQGDMGVWGTWGRFLSSNNYTSYTPSLTGSGASGTWGINITGNANTAGNASTANYATSAESLNSTNYINRTSSTGNLNTDFQNTPAGTTRFQGDHANLTNSPGNTWWIYQNMRHSNSSSYWGTQVAWGWEDNANRLATRNVTGNSFGAWVYYLNSSNYTSYAPSLTGSGASGTWGINITGNANNITQYTINQSLGTGNAPTFTDLYNNQWFRNNNSNTGLYNQVTTQHWSSNTNGYWDASSTTTVSAIRFYTGGHVTSLRGYVYADSSNNIGFLNNSGSWSFRCDSSGNVTATGDVTAYSDSRVKENVTTVENAIEKINSLRGVYYNRIDSDDKKTKLGVIAQEVLKVVPEVVGQDSDGMYNVAYGNLAGLFIEAIKEQQTQIEELKKLVNQLTNK